MMYYIDRVNTWSAANRKCLEVQKFVAEFRQTIIADEAAAEALVEEIGRKVEELNEKYPRTKRLVTRKEGGFVYCVNVVQRLGDQYVFTFHIMNVRQTYRAIESATGESEGK